MWLQHRRRVSASCLPARNYWTWSDFSLVSWCELQMWCRFLNVLFADILSLEYNIMYPHLGICSSSSDVYIYINIQLQCGAVLVKVLIWLSDTFSKTNDKQQKPIWRQNIWLTFYCQQTGGSSWCMVTSLSQYFLYVTQLLKQGSKDKLLCTMKRQIARLKRSQLL